MENITLIDIINVLFFVYGIIIFASYILTAMLSVMELSKYFTRNRRYDYNAMLGFECLPTISILAPAYNEVKTIIQNIIGLLIKADAVHLTLYLHIYTCLYKQIFYQEFFLFGLFGI